MENAKHKLMDDIHSLGAKLHHKDGATKEKDLSPAAAKTSAAKPHLERSERKRTVIAPRKIQKSPFARAKRATEEQIRLVFAEAGGGDAGLSLENLDEFLSDFLGYGQAEVVHFFEQHQ